MSRSPNVFILTADSLRSRSFVQELEDITAATNGTLFKDAVAPSTETGSSMPALATGQYCDQFDEPGIPETGNPVPLGEHFSVAGYETSLWTDNYLFGRQYNYNRGIDAGNLGEPTFKKRIANTIQNSVLEPAFKPAEWIYFNVAHSLLSIGSEEHFYRSADALNESVLNWLERHDNEVFCWLHYMDPHHPYEPPTEYLADRSFNTNRTRGELAQLSRDVIKNNGEGYTEAEIKDVRTAYEAACTYLGDAVIEFVQTLVDKGYFDPEQDIFVFSADHGECLSPERGMMGHIPPAFWEDIISVPLLIAAPQWDRDRVVGQTNLIDLTPTVLELAELTVSASTDGTARRTPDEMVQTATKLVTHHVAPNTDTWHTYRCVRTDDGAKLFGAQRRGREETILTQRDEHGEREVYSTAAGKRPTTTPAADQWDALTKHLAASGGAIQEGSGVDPERIDDDHLRDLGYLD
jgi:arylsulfatase A-like enzyme